MQDDQKYLLTQPNNAVVKYLMADTVFASGSGASEGLPMIDVAVH